MILLGPTTFARLYFLLGMLLDCTRLKMRSLAIQHMNSGPGCGDWISEGRGRAAAIFLGEEL